jgi:protein SCO1
MTRFTPPLVILALAVAVAGCGSTGSNATAAGSPDAIHPGLQGLILKPRKPAPPIVLHNFTGQPVSLASFRGKAVLVTFVYTHCPNVCPLIISDLAAAQRGLGKEANHLQILAVTVDPKRDTPSDVRTFLAARGATGRMDYLLGSRAQLHKVWKAWDVGITVDKQGLPTGHSSIIYGITASGKMADVYPENFTPAQIIHDVPLLASS